MRTCGFINLVKIMRIQYLQKQSENSVTKLQYIVMYPCTFLSGYTDPGYGLNCLLFYKLICSRARRGKAGVKDTHEPLQSAIVLFPGG